MDGDGKRLVEPVVLGEKRFWKDEKVMVGGWEGSLLGLWYCQMVS